ncbi:hypothetical protein SAY86_023063 [Trapa natans]|nr:hypothetical protein SAY86_023063 [Trapa natans]
MAFSNFPLVVFVLAAAALTASAQVDPPTPSPESTASSVVPPLPLALLAGVAALLFGSSVRI